MKNEMVVVIKDAKLDEEDHVRHKSRCEIMLIVMAVMAVIAIICIAVISLDVTNKRSISNNDMNALADDIDSSKSTYPWGRINGSITSGGGIASSELRAVTKSSRCVGSNQSTIRFTLFTDRYPW